MNLEETGIVEENLFERGSRLQRFCTILNFELSTVVLFLLMYIWQVTIFLAAFAAMLFTPYLIFVLIKEKKTGWIIFFILLVIFPLVTIILFLSDDLFYLAYLLIPLPLFYFYCFIIRFDANGWLKEINGKIYNENQIKPEVNNDFITLK